MDAIAKLLAIVSDPDKIKARLEQLQEATSAAVAQRTAADETIAKASEISDKATAQADALDAREKDLLERAAAVEEAEASLEEARVDLSEQIETLNNAVVGKRAELRQATEKLAGLDKRVNATSERLERRERELAELEARIATKQKLLTQLTEA